MLLANTFIREQAKTSSVQAHNILLPTEICISSKNENWWILDVFAFWNTTHLVPVFYQNLAQKLFNTYSVTSKYTAPTRK